MVTSDGYPLVPDITIPEDARSISINAQGEVFAYFSDRVEPELLGRITLAGFANEGQGEVFAYFSDRVEPEVLGRITLAGFANEGGLEAIGSNLFLESAASGPPFVNDPGTEGLGTLRQGYLEESSIEAQRGYELNAKVITAADQMLGATTQIR